MPVIDSPKQIVCLKFHYKVLCFLSNCHQPIIVELCNVDLWTLTWYKQYYCILVINLNSDRVTRMEFPIKEFHHWIIIQVLELQGISILLWCNHITSCTVYQCIWDEYQFQTEARKCQRCQSLYCQSFLHSLSD